MLRYRLPVGSHLSCILGEKEADLEKGEVGDGANIQREAANYRPCGSRKQQQKKDSKRDRGRIREHMEVCTLKIK